MYCEPSPDPVAYGPARAGALRPDREFSSFCVMVDVVEFNPLEDTSMGVMARVQEDPGPGNINGYVFSYQGSDHDVQISRVIAEVPEDISGTPAVQLTEGRSYRLVFMGFGTQLEGRIYDLADLTTPLIRVVANDAVYSSGMTGLVIFSETNSRVSAGFDNFFASDGTPPPLRVAQRGDGLVRLEWKADEALCGLLETSTDLAGWSPYEAGVQISGEAATVSAAVEPGARFWRLRGLPFRE